MPIKLLHTSDVHLEAGLAFLGEKADAHRKLQLQTFKKIIEKIISEKFNLFLIAGDLFDTPFPSEKVKLFVFDQIKRLEENHIYTAIIAGNHDRLEKGSVYYDKIFEKLNPEFTNIFNQEGKNVWNIAQLQTTIYGVSLFKQKDNSSPVKKLKRLNTLGNHIALLHGSMEIGKSQSNNPIKLDELKKLNFKYVALGDWHSTKKISETPVVWYSGSPEIINIDQSGSGSVLEVNINEKTVVKEVHLSEYDVVNVDLDVSGLRSLSQVDEKFKQLPLKNKQMSFVELSIVGVKSLAAKFSTEDLYELLKSKVYYLKLKDKSKLEITEEELEFFPEEFLIGKYIRLLQNKKGEDYSQNQIIDEAIQLGVRNLQGKT